jgi:hypothetical protein
MRRRIAIFLGLLVALSLVTAIGFTNQIASANPNRPELSDLHQDGGPLPLGQTISGQLTADLPEQTWNFNADAGTRVSLLAQRTSGDGILTVLLRNDAGSLIVSLRSNDLGLAAVPQLYLEGGLYTLQLVGDFTTFPNPIGFDLTLTPTDDTFRLPTPTLPPTIAPNTLIAVTPTLRPTAVATILPSGFAQAVPGEQLEIGDVREGTFIEGSETHTYTFFAPAETIVTFGLNRFEDSTIDPAISLQDPDGILLIQNDNYRDSSDALVVNYSLPLTGVYTLSASSTNSQGSGHYLIALGQGFVLRNVNQGNAPHNQPVISALENYGLRDIWNIEASLGDRISVSVENWDGSSFDPMLELVAPTGETLAFDDDGGANKNAIVTGIYAPVTGTYRIHIAAYDHGSYGAYRLWWQIDNLIPTPIPSTVTDTPLPGTEPPPSLTPLPTEILTSTPSPVLSEQGSELSAVGIDEGFSRQIELEADTTLTVFVEGHWGFDGVLEIYGPDGTLLELVDDVGFDATFDRNPRLNLDVTDSGLYTIRVYGFEGGEGVFTLHWLVQ